MIDNNNLPAAIRLTLAHAGRVAGAGVTLVLDAHADAIQEMVMQDLEKLNSLQYKVVFTAIHPPCHNSHKDAQVLHEMFASADLKILKPVYVDAPAAVSEYITALEDLMAELLAESEVRPIQAVPLDDASIMELLLQHGMAVMPKDIPNMRALLESVALTETNIAGWIAVGQAKEREAEAARRCHHSSGQDIRATVGKGDAATVWKNGTHKLWNALDAKYAEDDPDWLCTIPLFHCDAPAPIKFQTADEYLSERNARGASEDWINGFTACRNAAIKASQSAPAPLYCECAPTECLGKPMGQCRWKLMGYAPAQPSRDEVGAFAIQVEKLLCKALGREWSAAGISIESLVIDLQGQQAAPQPAVAADYVTLARSPMLDGLAGQNGIVREVAEQAFYYGVPCVEIYEGKRHVFTSMAQFLDWHAAVEIGKENS